jgi:hypothetical protein
MAAIVADLQLVKNWLTLTIHELEGCIKEATNDLELTTALNKLHEAALLIHKHQFQLKDYKYESFRTYCNFAKRY